MKESEHISIIWFSESAMTTDMLIPMVADCSDFENFRSGIYVSGIIITLFSFVYKLVSSLLTTVIGLAVVGVGLLRYRMQQRHICRE